MPEGDTVAWAASRIRPVLEGRVPDEIHTPRNPAWPERLASRVVRAIGTHGKHLFVHFEGDLVLHSHLGMTGSWRIGALKPRSSRVWLGLRVDERWVTEVDGPLLELLTEGRVRFDQRLSALGPDVLSPEFDSKRFLVRLNGDDPSRPLGEALLDQRNVAGLGNIWKAEGCWEAGISPWRQLRSLSATEALSVVEAIRPRMLRSAKEGPRTIRPRVYRRAGRPCPRCGARIHVKGQGEANRPTFWCPGCQR